MVVRDRPRPIPRLTFLALILLASFNPFTACAEFSVEVSHHPAAALDQQFVLALLTPMSRLIESPYGDPTVIENPLALAGQSSTAAKVAEVSLAKSTVTPALHPGIETLKFAVEQPLSKIEMSPSEISESLLPLMDANFAGSAMPADRAAFAMSGR